MKLIYIGLCIPFWLAYVTANETPGDNIEDVDSTMTVILHKLWDVRSFPLPWMLHEDGIITNNSTGAGTAAVANANAVAQLSAGFQAWENVATSQISVSFGGETTTSDSGCDGTNLVTWSDTAVAFPAGVIAMGLTTAYVGPDLVLDAMNRVIPCGATTVTLPVATFPNGSIFASGSILDMDMTWNPVEFDYVTTPNATPNVLDIRSVATHEFGHMFGFSHSSLSFAGTDPATMFPIVDSTSIALQNNVRTLAADDEASSGLGYPDTGFWPGGAAPFTTGAISGAVLQPTSAGAGGVRVWAYDVSATAQPAYETFTATMFDWDPSLGTGDYVLSGLAPGDYFVCIVPWQNDVPFDPADDEARYNLTTNNGTGNTGFATEFYDDAISATAAPDPTVSTDLLRRVTVTAGQTTPNIDFVTDAQTADFMLVMDRSGSMNLASGTPGKNKLEALQDSANAFIDYLDLSGGHRLGLVQFEEVLVPLTPVFDLQALNAGSTGNAHDAIDTMMAGGWTNILDGIDEGVDQLTTIAAPSGRQVMLVFSDGKHNRPIGSDLNDAHDPVVDNDITFYSIGFGTSVDDAILSGIAFDSGGVHVNEQDLSALDLGKHFLSIAASAADETTLIDPRFELGAGESQSTKVYVTSDDRELAVAVLWETRDQKRVDVTLTSPGGCPVETSGRRRGFSVRRGETYQLVRIPLPFDCNGRPDREGTWTVTVRGATVPRGAREKVDVIVYGSSRTRLFARTIGSSQKPVLTARLVRNGHVATGGRIAADLVEPLRDTRDSERQDATKRPNRDDKPFVPEIPRKERTRRIDLFDDGNHDDGAAEDGLYGGALPVRTTGTWRIRVIAQFPDGNATLTKEVWTSVHFDGERLIGVSERPPTRRIRNRY